MNELELFGEKEETVDFETLSVLWNVNEITVRRAVKELFPDIIINGKKTLLTEKQCALIREKLLQNKRLDFKVEVESNADDDLLIIRGLEAAQRKILKLQEENETLKPRAIGYDKFMGSLGLMTVAEAAKLLGTGRNRLFGYLRSKNLLMSSTQPYQKGIDSGYFEVKENVIAMGNKDINRQQTFITPKGFDYIQKLYTGGK
jgi:phage antirepressor YoqD-like protein